MANRNKLFSSVIPSILPSQSRVPGALARCSSNDIKVPKSYDKSEVTKKDEEGGFLVFKDPQLQIMKSKYWNEAKAIKQLRRKNSYPRNVDNIVDLMNGLIRIRSSFPNTFTAIPSWLLRLREKRHLIEQKFLPHRHAILKPDLATAHFVVRRGGSVKFLGQPQWVGIRERKVELPNAFIPGLHVEAIKLEQTNLYYEGLKNLCDLNYLTSLSLKNLKQVDDWWLDWISTEHYLNLNHLDLTGCENVTYRGLSCFYRFENLKTLNVEGIPDPPEFKLACLMLQDIMPELDILGIDLSVPEEIKAVEDGESKLLPKVDAVQKV